MSHAYHMHCSRPAFLYGFTLSVCITCVTMGLGVQLFSYGTRVRNMFHMYEVDGYAENM